MITRSDNPPIKVTILWPRYESERVTGARHYAGTSCRIQEAWKTTNALAGRYQGSHWSAIARLKEAVQDRKKWRMLVEEKTRNRERTNVK
jgi:hypothetical protein